MFGKLFSFLLLLTSITTCQSTLSDSYRLDVNITSTPTPWTSTIQFPQFNRTNNTLLAVYTFITSTLSSQTNATNVLPPLANGYLYTSFNIDLSVNGTSLIDLYAVVNSPSYQLYQYQSKVDSSPIIKTVTKGVTMSSSPSLLNMFIGNTTTNVDVSATSQLWTVATESINPPSNGGNVIASYVTPPTASLYSITVKYYYN